MARASSLHRVLNVLERSPIGIMPEGRGSGHLIEPPAGSGIFLSILAHRGFPIYPLGIWEEEKTLELRLGKPFTFSLPHEVSRDVQDRLAREQAMVAVGRLLPEEYWGDYRDAIEASLHAQ